MRETRTDVGRRSSLVLAGVALATVLAMAWSRGPCALGADRAPGDARDEERWAVVEMLGRRVGWMRTTETTGPDGTIRSETEMKLSIARGAVPLAIGIRTVFVETADGGPVSAETTQQLGAAPVTKLFTFEDGSVTLRETQNDRTTTSTIPAPEGAWLTPAAARRYVEGQLAAGATEFSLRTLDPQLGLTPYTATYKVEGPTTVEALGKTVPAIKWRVTQSALPGAESVEFVDEHGEPVRSEISMGGITMTVVESEKEVALSRLEPAEIMSNTLVRPSKRIEGARESTRATYRLSVDGGALPALPTTGAQSVARLDDRSARVTIDVRDPTPAPDAADGAYTGRSSMIDPLDPAIEQLGAGALEGVGPDPRARAEALRRFVHSYIKEKDLDVGLATASQVCRTREGDCTEHAVLLAALLRTQGIPSRVASGLLYVDRFLGRDGVFGYHMWTQALLEVDGAKRWVDVDATLPDGRPADATHIALAVSALSEGDMINSMAALAPVLGRLRIEVEAVE